VQPAEAQAAARAALRYVDDGSPGIRRRRVGRGFVYIDQHGQPVRDKAELRRIRALAVPPAYVDVWICPLENGHLQTTGRDARGRKQYRYHKRWREVRDEAKYRRSIAFARALGALRKRVESDLVRPGLTREKVLATVVRLLDTTLARIGNEAYARENDSYGLTTLRSEHVRARRGELHLRFRGKSGIDHVIRISDRRLAAVIRRCRDLPGQELFSYIDENGQPVPIGSGDINAYVREATGAEFTAKDFRTWHGTMLCAIELSAAPAVPTTVERRRAVSAAVKVVSVRLRNTPTICRTCYVHPAVIDRFLLDGKIVLPKRPRAVTPAERHLSESEARVLRFLERESRRDERADLRRTLRKSLRLARQGRAAPFRR
jgi:DNA topoisomerase-1